MNQVVNRAIPIFEARFPGAKALFAFDNATSHAAYAEDALLAKSMNLSPGGKQPKMRFVVIFSKFVHILNILLTYLSRSTTYGNGIHQDMCFPDDYSIPELRGEPKGLKVILMERGLWFDGMKLKCKNKCEEGKINCCARKTMTNQPDFKAQWGKLEEAIISAGHEVIFYPKFHCELNFIENFWGSAKRYSRNNCDYTWEGLKRTVPQALASVPLSEIRRYARKSFRYMDVYRKGLTGRAAEYAVKKFRSHRRIPASMLMQ